MGAVNVDTLSIARDLRATELLPEQAEAIAAAIGRSMAEGTASKPDVEKVIARIDGLERTFSAQLQALDAQLTSKIDNAKSSLLIWLMGVIFATSGLLIAVLKYAPL